MASLETHSIAEIPEALLRSCTEHLWHYTVGFVRVERSERSMDAILLGSGVLVKVGGISAILTADHVLEVLPRSGRLGVILSDRSEHTTVDVSNLEYLSIARGDDSERGPDVGAIVLSPPIASTLGARKSYINLDRQRGRVLSNPPEDREGIWVVQGFVGEMTVQDPTPTPYQRVKGFCNFGAFGGVKDYVLRGAHDFFTFPLEVPPSETIPTSFGGCSGGGLWQVLLTKDERGELAVDHTLLQGLAFFQKPPQEGFSALVCHGPTSIYDVVYSAIEHHGA